MKFHQSYSYKLQRSESSALNMRKRSDLPGPQPHFSGEIEKSGVTVKMYWSRILQSNIKFFFDRSNFEILLFRDTQSLKLLDHPHQIFSFSPGNVCATPAAGTDKLRVLCGYSLLVHRALVPDELQFFQIGA